jgi:flagellar hook-basal body complex protein FliE
MARVFCYLTAHNTADRQNVFRRFAQAVTPTVDSVNQKQNQTSHAVFQLHNKKQTLSL